MRRLKIAFGKLETPPRHLQGTELPAYSKVCQHIPTYYFSGNPTPDTKRVRYERAEYIVWSSVPADAGRSEPRKRGTPYQRPHANPGGFVHEAYSVSRSRTPVFLPKTRGNRHKMACLIPNSRCRNLGLTRA